MSRSLEEIFGETKDSTKKTHWFRFPKEGGSLVLRFLPPYGSLKKAGRWNQFYKVAFGYYDTKGKMRVFNSPEVYNFSTKMTEVPCAATNRAKKIRAAAEEARKSGNIELAEKLNEQSRVFNVKKSYFVNAVDLQGNVGVIGLPTRMKKLLDAEINKLKAEGVDPIGITNGRFFVLTRTGTGNQTVHAVSVYKEKTEISGQKVEIEKTHTLTPSIVELIETSGADLGTLYVTPTSDEVRQMVEGGPAVVESIMDKYYSDRGGNGASGRADAEIMDDEEDLAPPVTEAAPLEKPVTLQTKSPETPAEMPVAAMATTSLQEMSNDDFLKKMGL